MSAENGACKLYVLNYGGNDSAAAAPRFVTADARKPGRVVGAGSAEWKFGDAKTQLRQYAVEASADDVAVARQTQDERFAGDERVASATVGVKQSEDIAVTAPFQYVGDATPLSPRRSRSPDSS